MGKQKRLADENGFIDDDIPEEVQTAADEYMKCLRAANKAKEKVNGAKETCMEIMDRLDCRRVRIDDGAKLLILDDTKTLKTEKIKPPKVDDMD
mgnify:CR=1 FL=1